MKIDNRKLDTALAEHCWTCSVLRAGVSPQTLRKIRQGREVRPDVVGRIAKQLEVCVDSILEVAE